MRTMGSRRCPERLRGGAAKADLRRAVVRAALLAWLAAAPAYCAAPYPAGHRTRLHGHIVMHLAGDGAELGAQHARLAGRLVRRVVKDVIVEGEGAGRYDELIRGAMVMERYLPQEYKDELKALAEGASVPYEQIVALQLFGDVQRGQRCTSYAVLGPATGNGECIVGRNMDYWDHGVTRYAACLLHYHPRHGIPFMTTSWTGITNGWTAMNEYGIVCANNSSYGGKDSIEGLSTCFMVRKVVQFARTVEEGVRIVESTPRACGTNLIIAGGDPPQAAIVEYDHDRVAVRWAKRGYVAAANGFRTLGREGFEEDETEERDTMYSYTMARDDILRRLIRQNYGRIDETMNFAAAEGVPIRSMNLHSALIFPQQRLFRVSMGKCPAADHPYLPYRLTRRGIVAER